MSLLGKTILVTRPREQASELVAEIERCGGRVVLFPTIDITDPGSWQECDQAISHLNIYDGIVFTSANGVRRFFERCEQKELGLDSWKHPYVYAVGERTRHEIEKRGVPVRFVPATYSSVSLSQYFTGKNLEGERFLIPRGNLGRDEIVDTLTGLGAIVDSVTVYNTVLPNSNGVEQLWQQLIGGGIDVVTFTSPSAAINFAALLSGKGILEAPWHAKIAAIGHTTADAILGLGLPVDMVARESTAKGLVDAVVTYYN